MFRRRFLLMLTLMASAAGLAWCTSGRDHLAATGQTLGSSGISALGALRESAGGLWDRLFGEGESQPSGPQAGWSGGGGGSVPPQATPVGAERYAAPGFGPSASAPGAAGRSAALPARDPCLGTPPPGLGGPFALTDQTGSPVSSASLLGRPMLIAFGFTFCVDDCRQGIQRLGEAAAALDAEGFPVTPVFITVDPERDSIPVLSAYVGHFHPRMIGLTGDLRETAAAAQAYQVYSRKRLDPSSLGGYTMDHTNYAYYVDAQGVLKSRFPENAAARDIALGVICRIRNG